MTREPGPKVISGRRTSETHFPQLKGRDYQLQTSPVSTVSVQTFASCTHSHKQWQNISKYICLEKKHSDHSSWAWGGLLWINKGLVFDSALHVWEQSQHPHLGWDPSQCATAWVCVHFEKCFPRRSFHWSFSLYLGAHQTSNTIKQIPDMQLVVWQTWLQSSRNCNQANLTWKCIVIIPTRKEIVNSFDLALFGSLLLMLKSKNALAESITSDDGFVR